MTKSILVYIASLSFLLLYSCNKQEERGLSPQTQKLQQNMEEMSMKSTMIGHQDPLAYGVYWDGDTGRSDIHDVLGDHPAVMAWDVSKLELDKEQNIDGVDFGKMKANIIYAYNSGAINSISWHMDNPLTGGDAWDVSSKEVVKSILPGGTQHEKYKSWLDKFANFLNDLKGKNGEKIPIIFRPFHELTGSWFWWGYDLCSAEDFKAIWIFTHDYLTKEKGIDHLLYSYSTSADIKTEAHYLERYPGDAYVDQTGFDNYQAEGENTEKAFVENNKICFDIISKVAKEKNKVFAFTEAGYAAIPDTTWFTRVLYPQLKGSNCSYVLFWRNANINVHQNHYFVPYPSHSTANNFIEFAGKDDIFTMREIGNMYE